MRAATFRSALNLAIQGCAFVMLFFLGASIASAETVQSLQTSWAQASYQQEGKTRVASLKDLAERSRQSLKAEPENAELHIWHGIITSSLAGEDGGLGALGLVREAREAFTKAIDLDDRALDGAAYTSLGALYHKVPGWPIAFGSDKKARRYLQIGIQHNPAGIDANYFLGEFLLNEGESELAKQYLENALKAPARDARPLADAGRRAEIRELLAGFAD